LIRNVAVHILKIKSRIRDVVTRQAVPPMEIGGSASGASIQSELGRETVVGPGEAVLASSSDVGTVMLKPDSRFVALGLPGRALAPMLHQVQDHIGVLLPRDSEPLRLLWSHISVMLDSEGTTDALQELIVTHVYDLVALALGPSPEAVARARHRALPAARLHAIKTDIIAHLEDNELAHRMPSRQRSGTLRESWLRWRGLWALAQVPGGAVGTARPAAR
jgi:hypothetical protein